jgi:alkylresorcinol/alkylpyrone synthase
VPPSRIAQVEVRKAVRQIFRDRPGIERLLQVFDNSRIEHRCFAMPLDWYERAHDADEVNRAYIEAATETGGAAVGKALNQAALSAADVDYLVYVNTTGLATPSIDARLINTLGMRRDIRRTPIWGRGCAGGVAGLCQVSDYLQGRPKEIGLLVAAEFCSLTFIRDDPSKSNIVATALFSDGVGAAVVAGAQTDLDGLPIVACRSQLFPDSLDVMGWNITSRGMQVVFDRRIPQIVEQHGRDELTCLLDAVEIQQSDIAEYLYHPGGPRVLEAYAAAYELGLDRFRYSSEILADYGNMSSATVLFVIERFLAQRSRAAGYAAVSALGPGFSSESLLLALPG